MARYDKNIAEKIAEIYGMGTGTIEEICEEFHISKSTFYEWQKSKLHFSDAIERYKIIRLNNMGRMALKGMETLLTKTEFTEETLLYETQYDKKKQKDVQKIVGIKRVTKTVMPNARIVEFVATNRMPGEWKNTSKIDVTSGGNQLGFGMFLQQTKTKQEIDEAEVYTPDHREQS